jgi:hypothetical protein
MGPLAVEMDAMVQSGTADVWDELSVQRRIELKAWVRAQGTMRAWEQYQAEKDST